MVTVKRPRGRGGFEWHCAGTQGDTVLDACSKNRVVVGDAETALK